MNTYGQALFLGLPFIIGGVCNVFMRSATGGGESAKDSTPAVRKGRSEDRLVEDEAPRMTRMASDPTPISAHAEPLPVVARGFAAPDPILATAISIQAPNAFVQRERARREAHAFIAPDEGDACGMPAGFDISQELNASPC